MKENKKEKVYEDKVEGKISEERYLKMGDTYETEQADLKEKAISVGEENVRAQKVDMNKSKMLVVADNNSSMDKKQYDGKKSLGGAIPNRRRRR